MKKQIGILIDSSCTYDSTFIKENNIEIIPLAFSDSQNKTYDDDNSSINRDELMRRLDNHESFKTSAAPIGKLITKVESMLTNYEKIIFLPISHGLSSMYAQSLIVKQEFPDNFFPVRSLSGAAANEFVLRDIAQNVHKNMDVQSIIDIAEKQFNRISTYFSCEDLSGMSSGGRVTKTIMKVINILKLKPIIQLDNKNQYGGIGKNYQSVIKKIIKSIKNDFDNKLLPENILNIYIYYTAYEDIKKDTIINLLSEGFMFPKEKIVIRDLPNIVLIHTHRGSYGVSLETNIEHKIKKYDD
ncbi:MAG: DegV family EDD domain-containing protein [Mycoplasmataceae bacterium]|jgi:DegV family protein with EDD domain|nr:DegV family EDD domain-containing protein [Mycoplasmataceae bacterium]